MDGNIGTFLLYLQHGHDLPFVDVAGGVEDVFDRMEIQSKKDGKVPHHHTLLFFNNIPQNEAEINELLHLIRGSVEVSCTDAEKQELIDKGFIDNPDCFIAFLLDYQKKLKHHCTTRCMIRVNKMNQDGERTSMWEKNAKHQTAEG